MCVLPVFGGPIRMTARVGRVVFASPRPQLEKNESIVARVPLRLRLRLRRQLPAARADRT